MIEFLSCYMLMQIRRSAMSRPNSAFSSPSPSKLRSPSFAQHTGDSHARIRSPEIEIANPVANRADYIPAAARSRGSSICSAAMETPKRAPLMVSTSGKDTQAQKKHSPTSRTSPPSSPSLQLARSKSVLRQAQLLEDFVVSPKASPSRAKLQSSPPSFNLSKPAVQMPMTIQINAKHSNLRPNYSDMFANAISLDDYPADYPLDATDLETAGQFDDSPTFDEDVCSPSPVRSIMQSHDHLLIFVW